MKFSMRAVALPILLSCFVASQAQVDVLTRSYNNSRTGANTSETTLQVSNVKVTKFGKLYARQVIGQVDAQPLVVTGVTLPKVGTKNLLIVATERNAVYGWDADSGNVGLPYWNVNLHNPVPSFFIPDYTGASPYFGISGTPVVDKPNNTLYVVTKGLDPVGNIHLWLNAIDIRTGKYRSPNGMVDITATVPGVGAGTDNGLITMQPTFQVNKAGLLLANGTVYVALCSHQEIGPYHGWMLAYDAATLTQSGVYCTTQDGGQGGIWMSGQGPAADSNNNIYFTTGVGDIDFTGVGAMTGNSLVELNLSGGVFNLVSFFTPYDAQDWNFADDALGSSGAVLLPDVNEILIAGETPTMYLTQPGNMGGFNTMGYWGGGDNVLQTFLGQTGRLYSSPVYWNCAAFGPATYSWAQGDQGRRFLFTPGNPSLVGPSGSPAAFQLTPETSPNTGTGANLTLSANSGVDGTGVLWATMPWVLGGNPTNSVILRAYNASNIGQELWNSAMVGGDYAGLLAPNTPVTVANGFVYVSTWSQQVVVYGLLPHKPLQPVFPIP